MPDDPQQQPAAGTPPPTGGSSVTVPDDVRKSFPDIVELILKSESMNDEERQYWVNILPIMTPAQIQNLRDILTNERQQLAAIDAKYTTQIGQIGQDQFMKQVAEERRKKQTERSQAEQTAKQNEASSAEDVLKLIEGN